MSIKKQYLKSKPMCKVTFRIPEEAANSAKKANIVGDFNNWNLKSSSMKKLKNGSFTATINLEPGKEYQFRYLLDATNWENDSDADKYVPTPFGDSDNSVIVI
jgi:1,4-alpha-glucan branching enzyme